MKSNARIVFGALVGGVVILLLMSAWNGVRTVTPQAPARSGSASSASATPHCRATGTATSLPTVVLESSGLARSTREPGVFWTHNDRGSGPSLFAVDEQGRLLRTVRVRVPATDWEDLDIGPCDDGSCLYVGDIGDNNADREVVTIYRMAEPGTDATEVSAVALRVRFPDGPNDAESLFVLPTGDLFLVTKGRHHEIALYWYPSPQRPNQTVLLERVRQLFTEPDDNADYVTAATATPNGRWIGIRTYRSLYIYDARRLLSGRRVDPMIVDLRPLAEAQGEGLVMADDGTIWLSSEAGTRRGRAALNRIECPLSE
jgi:hypothetical protein